MTKPTDGQSGRDDHDEDEVVRAAYARAKAAFTEADLQRYLEEEEGVPLEDVIKELEEMQRQREAQRG
jgi:hypothetical protein